MNPKSKVLIVDDEPLNRKLIDAQLSNEQYNTILASNGVTALEKVKADSPDLIILDVMMPGMNGLEVLKNLKENPDTKDIPVILLTALSGFDDKIRGLKAGADEFLNKPVNSAELKSRVKSLLRLKLYQDQLKVHLSSHQVALDLQDIETSKSPIILLVEDNDSDAQMMQHYLKAENYHIQRIKTGEEEMAVITRDKIDLILQDILLPGLDGFDVINRIREMNGTRHVQVLVITSLQDLESKIKGIDLGADDYLIKPINQHELQLRVTMLLKKKAYLDALKEIGNLNP